MNIYFLRNDPSRAINAHRRDSVNAEFLRTVYSKIQRFALGMRAKVTERRPPRFLLQTANPPFSLFLIEKFDVELLLTV